MTRLLRQGDCIRLKVQTICGWKGDAVVIQDQLSSDDIIAWRRDCDDPSGPVSIAMRHEIALKALKRPPLLQKKMTDFHSLCIRLIIATDADNAKAQDYIINQIRLALHKEYGGFIDASEEQQLSSQNARIAPY